MYFIKNKTAISGAWARAPGLSVLKRPGFAGSSQDRKNIDTEEK